MLKLTGLTLAILGTLLVGCSKNDSGTAKGTSSPGSHDMQGMSSEHGASGGHEMGEHEMGETGAAAVLPPGANKTCPVMGEEVDPSVFVSYKGKKVYFCCDNCVKKFEKDPERYFLKAYPDAGKR